ncbi:MAG: hypothetical protein ACSHYA_12805 [Opitutaceae bacterium]
MSETSLPDCPGSLESNVLRRIRVAGDETSLSLFDWVLALIPRPGFIATAFALTIAISFSMTVHSNKSQQDIGQSEMVASKALGFEVFQSNDFFDLNNK